MDTPHMTDSNRRLYSYLPQGFPMNPLAVSQGVHFINDKKESNINRIKAYRLLAEFHHIVGGFVPELRDLAMQEILNDDVYLHKVYTPCPNNHQLWDDFPIHQDEEAFTGNQRNKTGGAGLPPVSMEQLLDIELVAQYTMHHARLGSSNAVHGIAMNVALQADH